MQNSINIDSNAITSVFGKSNAISKQLYEAVDDYCRGKKHLFYWDKKEAMPLLQQAGLQLPSSLPQDGFVYSIRGKGSPVNIKFKDVTESSQYKRWFGDWQKHPEKASQVVNENGEPAKVYHGTSRSDRIEESGIFLPERATSGPMPFWTTNKEIAENYSRDKKDTSLDYDERFADYNTQFRVERNGKSISVTELWNTLSPAQKQQMRERAKHITFDDEAENIIYDKQAEYGNGGYDAYTLNANGGNVISAMVDTWLYGGNLFGNEEKFLEVLNLLGIKDVKYFNPNARYEKVYEAYLNIRKPFDTSTVDKSFISELQRYINDNNITVDISNANGDFWDKNRVTPELFIKRLNNDLEYGTSHAWTSIPDFVTSFLIEKGYDGIKDEGGKNGGQKHTVWIPFYSEQTKTTDNIGLYGKNQPKFRFSKDTLSAEEADKLNETSKLYDSLTGKDVSLDGTKGELEKNEGRFKYSRLSNNKTYKKAQEYVRGKGIEDSMGELASKAASDKLWNADDMARAEYIFTQLQKEGRTTEAVNFAVTWSAQATKAGQAVQAMAILNRLTPKHKGTVLLCLPKYLYVKGTIRLTANIVKVTYFHIKNPVLRQDFCL